MNIKINAAKIEAEKLGKSLKTAITVLSAQVKSFTEANKDDLDGRSKDMNFGAVGFRLSSRITYSPSKTAEIIKALKDHEMTEYHYKRIR